MLSESSQVYQLAALLSEAPRMEIREWETSHEYSDDRRGDFVSHSWGFSLVVAVDPPPFVRVDDPLHSRWRSYFSAAIFRSRDLSCRASEHRAAVEERLVRRAEELDPIRTRDAWVERRLLALGISRDSVPTVLPEYERPDPRMQGYRWPYRDRDQAMTAAWVSAGSPLDWRSFAAGYFREEVARRGYDVDATLDAARRGRLFEVKAAFRGDGARDELIVATNKWDAKIKIRQRDGLNMNEYVQPVWAEPFARELAAVGGQSEH